jgi:hypothetical protein
MPLSQLQPPPQQLALHHFVYLYSNLHIVVYNVQDFSTLYLFG